MFIDPDSRGKSNSAHSSGRCCLGTLLLICMGQVTFQGGNKFSLGRSCFRKQLRADMVNLLVNRLHWHTSCDNAGKKLLQDSANNSADYDEDEQHH